MASGAESQYIDVNILAVVEQSTRDRISVTTPLPPVMPTLGTPSALTRWQLDFEWKHPGEPKVPDSEARRAGQS